MDEKVKKRLEAEDQDDQLVKLRDKVVSLVKMSRGKMSKKYGKWDKHNDTYLGVRSPDEADMQARDLDEPEKMVVPMGFAQVQTFVAFAFMLFTQNRRFFELIATGSEDYETVNDGEELLERDMRWNYWNSQLYQLLLDVARFNMGIKKTTWSEEKQYAPVTITPETTDVQGYGFTKPAETSWQEFTKFEGNRIQSISPYNFFPDTRFPLSEWRKGSFCADETEWHISKLKERERQGEVAGVSHISPMDRAKFTERGKTRLEAFSNFMDKSNKDEDEQIVCITECHMEIVPSDYDLSEVNRPVKYVIEIANDDRVIRAEPANYLHDEWVYDVAQFSPDQHQQVGDCLLDTIDALQDVVSYLINSRLMSVRRSLDNNLVIDPSGVDMSTVESRSPWILMKKGSPRLGVDKFVRQLNFVDTTSNHLNDADLLMKVMQIVTGVNENAMGQFAGGRRSATEARAVNAGAASRMKMTSMLIWTDCLMPLGRKMLSNLRQGISEGHFVKVLGESARLRYATFHPNDPSALIGMCDHFVFDSTLQSEKGFIAQSLQELVTAMFSSPETMMMLGMDVTKMIGEIMQLRGVDNIERFKVQPQLPGSNGPIGPTLPQQIIGAAGAQPGVNPGIPAV